MVLASLIAGVSLSGPAAHAGDGFVSSAQEVSPILVGTTAPDGTLKTAAGRETTLGQLLDGQPGVLIFYRGHW
jgi:hypothetical protein